MNLKKTITEFMASVRNGEVLTPEVEGQLRELLAQPEAKLAARLCEGHGDFALAALRAGAFLDRDETVEIGDSQITVAVVDLALLLRLLDKRKQGELR